VMFVVAPAWVARILGHRAGAARRLAVIERLAGDPVARALAEAHGGVERLLEDGGG
jgi:hypothetical protein